MIPVDQRFARIKKLIADRPELFARQAAVVATWRFAQGRRLGPYYSLRYRDGRRQCSVYLGASAETADAVCALLAAAQRTRREQLALDRTRAIVKASLKRHMSEVRRQLEPCGLTLKGFEIRGWRSLDPQARMSLVLNFTDGGSMAPTFHGASLTAGSSRSSGEREAAAL